MSSRVRLGGRAPDGSAAPSCAGEGTNEPEVVRLRISAPTVEDALQLIDALPGVHAELAPLETSYAVLVEIRGNASRQLADTLARIDRWLGATGSTTSRIELDGRGYAVEVPPLPVEV